MNDTLFMRSMNEKTYTMNQANRLNQYDKNRNDERSKREQKHERVESGKITMGEKRKRIECEE